jgi:hypothetical protein
MRTLQLIIGMIVVGVAYSWRSTQAGGVSAVDRICFDAQIMKP